ncbi:hypothetical protein [Mesorhizobium sp. M2A.F.Ca.ET.067.02.1.1]|uniref:hypothetical protein n=1 Tax=Mesorhizobium sp. M2A.F.Ca.ET.067.02.1.1 TaxID=2496749 RepID=UPI000FD55AA9|nr:hypothetical protein [Mesorhizobium sp. M2A.F.Ca.ET.067.02.1.1]RUW79634.1 hypothetical protein EOA28_07505 [Mesorhizobium sp. M2A.F.Ca.ET.067.02.1.1]
MLAIKVDKRPISQAQLLGFVVVLVVQAFAAGGIYWQVQSTMQNAASKHDLSTLAAKVDAQETDRDRRWQSIDRTLADISDKLKPLDNVTYRLDQQDKRNDAQDNRIDRTLDIMGTKFDALTAAVGEVKADLRALAAKSQPTTYRSP